MTTSDATYVKNVLYLCSDWWPLAYLLLLTLDGVVGKGERLASSCLQQSDNRSARCLWLVALLSCDLFSPSRATGIWHNPFPRHICFCVVRRDRDGDAVISGLDFTLTSTQLVSLPLSLSIYLPPREKEQWKGLSVMAQDQREREGERERKQKRRKKPR